MKSKNVRRALVSSLLALTSATAVAQVDDSWMLYDDTHLGRIDVTIDPTLLQWIFDHPQSDSEHVATVRFRNNWIDETVDSIGFRLRGNTSRDSHKQSFKVSFNTFIAGREFHGVDKLNLNGEHNDPSIIRSKLCFDLFGDLGMRASRANHVQLFINGLYRGLYISVEHVDDEFLNKRFSDDSGNLWKCLYPADLVYLGSSPELYRQLNSNGRPAYELKTNEELNDFSALARFIDVLNNTTYASLPDSLERFLDVPSVLKYFAFNVLTGSWDDYWSLMNNYYLYHEPSSGKFWLIPYDYDNTFGIDWFGINWSTANPYAFPRVAGGYRPLAERLLAVPQYRDLYTHFLDFMRTSVHALPRWEGRIDRLRTMITPAALADSFRTLDYGFTAADFANSYSASSYQNQHVKFGLKQFVNARVASIGPQLSVIGSRPIVYGYALEPRTPKSTDSIALSAACYGSAGVSSLQAELTKEGETLPTVVALSASPVAQTTKVEEADRWLVVLPPLAPGSYRLRFAIRDGNGLEARYPLYGPLAFRVSGQSSSGLVINEFMADNDGVAQDPSGEYDDWVELYNTSSSAISLGGKYLTDKSDNRTKWRFSNDTLSIGPGGYVIIWCDEQETQPGLHANFKLSASGEYIALVDADGVTVIDSLSFGAQQTDVAFGRYPDGSASWQKLVASPGAPNILTGLDAEELPGDFSLGAYPNPFNPELTIEYALSSPSDVELSIHDILGRRVWFTTESRQGSGRHTVRWAGTGMDGRRLTSGMYVVRLRAGNRLMTTKVSFIR